MHQQTRSLRNTPRWELAAKDVNLKFPEAAGVFSCALDMPISPEATPHLNMLLRRTLIDAGLATYKAKDHYSRQRPFAQLGESTCAPKEEAQLAKAEIAAARAKGVKSDRPDCAAEAAALKR